VFYIIVFYSFKNGKIIGTIEGRVHQEDHLKMYVGDPKTTGRVICSWVKNEHGKYEPEDPIYLELENSNLSNFMVDVVSKKIVRV